MVRIRMSRLGRRRRPFYRISAVDIRTKRDGKVLEQLGWYDPLAKEDKQIFLEEERIKEWLKRGAQPSETVMDILAKHNIVDAAAWKAQREARLARKKANQPAAAAEGEKKAE
jgi:small subunit ribosomal protein S16